MNTLVRQLENQEQFAARMRHDQATQLYAYGWALGGASLLEYQFSIPEMPVQLAKAAIDGKLYPVLVDERRPLSHACRTLGIWYPSGVEQYIVDSHRNPRAAHAYWIGVVMQPSYVPNVFERGLTLLQGIALYVQYPDLFSEQPVICANSYTGNAAHFRVCLMYDKKRRVVGAVDARLATKGLVPNKVHFKA